MKKLLFIILLYNLIPSCKKDGVNLLISDQVTENQYYDNEIFNDSNQRIYGKWKFLFISGGIAPSMYDPTYDYLEVVKIGIYGIVTDNTINQIGKIIVQKQDNTGLRIVFSPDNKYQSNTQTTTREVIFIGNDSLSLWDGMMDGYSSYYKRVK